LNELSLKNHLLAKELGKLPELQDGISESETSSLEDIVDIYSEIPKEFNDAFGKMYQVGKPEVRKYCSPLQALFWLVESDRTYDARGILKHYSLDDLLHTAWPSKKSVLTEYQTLDIIDGMKNEHDRKEYKEWYSRIDNSKKLWSHLLTDYLVEPGKFSERGQRALAKLMKPPETFREEEWKDYKTAVTRLNAPVLLDYYLDGNFRYEYIPGISGEKSVFKAKRGHCREIAQLGASILQRNGYNPTIFHSIWPGMCPDCGHVVVILPENGKFRVVVDFTRGSRNTMSGPFNSYSEFERIRYPGRHIIRQEFGFKY
jgi:hypothetical protein